MNGLVQRVSIGEGLVGKVMGLEIAPDGFDIVQLWCVFAALCSTRHRLTLPGEIFRGYPIVQ